MPRGRRPFPPNRARAPTAGSRFRRRSFASATRISSAAPGAGRSTRSSTSGDSISTTGSSSQQRAALDPARVTGRTFADFDDERVQADGTETMGDRLRTRLYLEGVHCAACVWLVEKLPAVLRGVDEVRLNIGTGVAEISWRPAQTRLSAIGRALDRLGYTPHIHGASRVQEARRAEDRASLARLGVAAACAMNLMFLHGALYAGDYSGMDATFERFFRWFSLVVAVPVLVYSARPFFQTALAGLKARVVHIDLPIAVALAVTFAASAWNAVRGSGPLWFDSLAMLVAALLGARQLQRSAQRAALERADSLRGAAFLEFARRIDGDGPDAPVVEVPLAALVPGDRVEIRSGETRSGGRRHPVRALVNRQRCADRRGCAWLRSRGRHRQCRRHESRGEARRSRRCGGREDAHRRAAGRRAGGALEEAGAAPDDRPAGSALRAGAAGPGRRHGRGVVASGPCGRSRARRGAAGRRLPVRARPVDSAGAVGGADARGAGRDLREEPGRPRAAAPGRHRAARQDGNPHGGAGHRGALGRRRSGAATRAGAGSRVGARRGARVPEDAPRGGRASTLPPAARQNRRAGGRGPRAGHCRAA